LAQRSEGNDSKTDSQWTRLKEGATEIIGFQKEKVAKNYEFQRR